MNDITVHTFAPLDPLPSKVIFPQQTHGNRVTRIVTGTENLAACDGIWTSNPQFKLGVKTADCAPICLWNNDQFGVLHAGWRGSVNGAIENMLSQFGSSTKLNIWVGPLYPEFEIQKDDCYDLIWNKFGEKFFHEIPLSPFEKGGSKIIFKFKDCLSFLLPDQTIFDERSTFLDESLSSWRRDKAFPKGQNSTVIGIL